MSNYEGEAGVLIASAKCQYSDGSPGTGGDLCDALHERMVSVPQGCDGVPCLAYGDPSALLSYRGGTDVATLSKFIDEHRTPPSPSPPAPPTPPPPPTPPAGQYVLSDQSYTCPVGYVAIQTDSECQSAAASLGNFSGSAEVTHQSDPDDPPSCWAYGATGSYTNLYMNSVGATTGTRPLRSALCKHNAPAPPTPPSPPSPSPSESYVVADQSYECPAGYEPITTTTGCHDAGVAKAGFAAWAVVASEDDPADPIGCWAYGSKGSYSFLYVNTDGTKENTRDQRSVLCKLTRFAV